MPLIELVGMNIPVISDKVIKLLEKHVFKPKRYVLIEIKLNINSVYLS
jgi:hypothetical protein